MGLVNKVVDDDELEEQVRSWCAEITALSPRYFEIAKVSSNIWLNSARGLFSNGLGVLIQAIGSEDVVEGPTPFSRSGRRSSNFMSSALRAQPGRHRVQSAG